MLPQLLSERFPLPPSTTCCSFGPHDSSQQASRAPPAPLDSPRPPSHARTSPILNLPTTRANPRFSLPSTRLCPPRSLSTVSGTLPHHLRPPPSPPSPPRTSRTPSRLVRPPRTTLLALSTDPAPARLAALIYITSSTSPKRTSSRWPSTQLPWSPARSARSTGPTSPSAAS